MKPTCFKCDSTSELMIYSQRKRVDESPYTSYICRSCRRAKDRSQAISHSLSAFKSKESNDIDFVAASKASVDRLSKRPFYAK